MIMPAIQRFRLYMRDGRQLEGSVSQLANEMYFSHDHCGGLIRRFLRQGIHNAYFSDCRIIPCARYIISYQNTCMAPHMWLIPEEAVSFLGLYGNAGRYHNSFKCFFKKRPGFLPISRLGFMGSVPVYQAIRIDGTRFIGTIRDMRECIDIGFSEACMRAFAGQPYGGVRYCKQLPVFYGKNMIVYSTNKGKTWYCAEGLSVRKQILIPDLKNIRNLITDTRDCFLDDKGRVIDFEI